jgi:hypothetical protein
MAFSKLAKDFVFSAGELAENVFDSKLIDGNGGYRYKSRVFDLKKMIANPWDNAV